MKIQSEKKKKNLKNRYQFAIFQWMHQPSTPCVQIYFLQTFNQKKKNHSVIKQRRATQPGAARA